MSSSLDKFRAETPRSRAEELALALEADIRDRGLAPGEMISTMPELRAATGLARSTVSEAVRLLRERGLIEIRPGRGGGLFVVEPTPVIRLRHTLLTVGQGATTTSDAIELREALEAFIALQACRYHTDDDIVQLRTDLAAMYGAQDDWEAFMKANWALHRHIAMICPNEMARAVYLSTLGYLQQASSPEITGDTPELISLYRRRRYVVHEELVNAIADGDESSLGTIIAEHNSPA